MTNFQFSIVAATAFVLSTVFCMAYRSDHDPVLIAQRHAHWAAEEQRAAEKEADDKAHPAPCTLYAPICDDDNPIVIARRRRQIETDGVDYSKVVKREQAEREIYRRLGVQD